MDRNQTPGGPPAAATPPPPPGWAALVRHLDLLKDLDRSPPIELRDVSGRDDWEGRSIDRLASLVGGLDALQALDTSPLPAAEPFDFGAIDATDRPAVQAVLGVLHDHRPPHFDAISKIVGSHTPRWLHDEYVTILHRLVARAATRGAAGWHRDPRRMAAAFVWLALGGNGALGRGRNVSAQEIWRWYGVGDCRALARRVCVDACLGSLYPPDDDPVPLSDLHIAFGDVQVLHSSFRRRLAKSRDDVMRLVVDLDRRRSSQRPVKWVGDGQLSFKARQVQPLWAFKAPSTTGRAAVMVAFGRSTDDDDYELVGLTVPDARLLLSLVQDAVDAPSHSGTARGLRADRTPP